MATELEKTDISGEPELLRLVEELVASRSPRVLTNGEEALAIVTPVDAPEQARSRRPGTSTRQAHDSILNIIGIAASSEPTDVAQHERRYLAEAYETEQP